MKMSTLIALSFVFFSFLIGPADDVHNDPELVVKEVFAAAQTGEFKRLTGLCDPEKGNDGDTRRICAVGDATPEKQADFKLYFSSGKIIDKASFSGDTARVKIKFGPNGDKDETFILIRRSSKWYLYSI